MASTKSHSTRTAPTQVWPENVQRGPIQHSRTIRPESVSVVTSGAAGKFLPLKYIPLLREDGVRNGSLAINVQMAETAEMLLNPVRVSVMAYLVPKLAFERFPDMGAIDRSYNGQTEVDGSLIPWFETTESFNNAPIYTTAGLHKPNKPQAGKAFNLDYASAYNVLWNYIAAQRSSSLTLRAENAAQLAPAFWEHTQMKHVVPTFDDAMMEGVVPITFSGTGRQMVRTESTTANTDKTMWREGGTGEISYLDAAETNKLFTELAAEDFQLTLANIDLARQTAAWSRLRNRYQGYSEDWIIDQLLAGIRFNDTALKAPILLDHSDTIIGMSQRYATDAANLNKSMTDGRAQMMLNIRTPAVPCGGIIVIAAQALPEMIYERQRDYYFAAESPAQLPNRTADELDPQPVSMLKNAEVAEDHTDPETLFGYAPLNHEWIRNAPNIGGKYYKAKASDPWTEERNRIWTTETVDPTLGPDFYLSNSVSQEVFAAGSTADPFEWWVGGELAIEGLTYFGPQLREALDDYEKVAAQVPTERVKGDGTDVPAE